MYENSIDFGTNLRKYRKEAGISRARLADMISYSHKSVERWELEGLLPPVTTICKIADIFGVTVDNLIYSRDRKIKYLLAVDGGGTKTEFLLTDLMGNELAHEFLGASNPVDIGMENTEKLLEQGIRSVCKGIDFREVSAFVGLAGGITGNNKEIMREFLKKFRFGAYSNGSDTENVLEVALEGQDGIAVIMGTGIIAFSQQNGNRKRIGGWGYHIDRGGSGYDLGSGALREALKNVDGRGGSAILRQLIEDRMGCTLPESISDIYRGGKSAVAAFAPVVFRAYDLGDPSAREIIKENVREVSDMIASALNHLAEGRGKVVICGGLVKRRDILERYFAEFLGDIVQVTFLDKPIVNGALMMARKIKDKGDR